MEKVQIQLMLNFINFHLFRACLSSKNLDQGSLMNVIDPLNVGHISANNGQNLSVYFNYNRVIEALS